MGFFSFSGLCNFLINPCSGCKTFPLSNSPTLSSVEPRHKPLILSNSCVFEERFKKRPSIRRFAPTRDEAVVFSSPGFFNALSSFNFLTLSSGEAAYRRAYSG